MLPIAGTWLYRRFRRGRQIVDAWARSNHLRVVRRVWGGWRVGPFPVAAFGKQSVHYLEVVDQEGRARRCWLKIGDFIVGQLDDRVEVVWEGDAA